MQPNIGGLRSSVEKPERLQASNQGRHGEDREVNGEVNLDKNEEFLEGEVSSDAVKKERDE